MVKKIRIAIGGDHAGWKAKQAALGYLKKEGYELFDVNPEYDKDDDFPLIAENVARDVGSGEYKMSFLTCGTGQGMSIVGNKIKGVRAALCHSLAAAKQARQHLDANILVVPGYLAKYGPYDVEAMLYLWFRINPLKEERYERRIYQIKNLEERIFK